MVKTIRSKAPTYLIPFTPLVRGCIDGRGRKSKAICLIYNHLRWLLNCGRDHSSSAAPFRSLLTTQCTEITQPICLYSWCVRVVAGTIHAPTCIQRTRLAYTSKAGCWQETAAMCDCYFHVFSGAPCCPYSFRFCCDCCCIISDLRSGI